MLRLFSMITTQPQSYGAGLGAEEPESAIQEVHDSRDDNQGDDVRHERLK